MLHACLHLFRHIAQKCSAIHKVLPALFRQSDKKSDGAIAQQSLCGVALKRAKEHLQEKHDSCGVDGMRLSELDDYIQNNLSALRSSIIDGTYRPGPVQEVELINSNGKKPVVTSV